MSDEKENKQVQNFEAVNHLKNQVKKAVIVGRIVDGKIEIDQQEIDELAKTNPNAFFVALNSPFDPTPCIL